MEFLKNSFCFRVAQLFSESAHSAESNQRPCNYADPHDISFNANHVPASSPNLATAVTDPTTSSSSTSNVTMTNLLRGNPNTKHLNEMTHRHSFNESIYSEPYGGRYLAAVNNNIASNNNNNINRMESNRSIPLSESASASNIYSRVGGIGGASATVTSTVTSATAVPVSAHRTYPPYFFSQNYLSHRDVYGTASSVAHNGLSSEVSSARSSVYSDKTILYESTPPSTPRSPPPLLSAIKQTNYETNPNKTNASNASGSQFQSILPTQSIYNTKTNSTATATSTTTMMTIVPEKPSHHADSPNVERSATKQCNTDDEQSKI